jgi:hypothetical protein
MSRYFPWSVLLLAACVVLMAGIPFPAHAGWTVLFDQGHGQRFTTEGKRELDLSGLAAAFRKSGYRVVSTKRALSPKLLAGTDALVLSGPFVPYAPPEIEAITAFVKRGGALCIMLHIGPPAATLLQRLGVEHSNGVINEAEGVIDNDPHDFRVTRVTPHLLFHGLHGFSLYGAWALLPAGDRVEAIATTSPAAWVDLNRNGRLDPADARQAFAVAVAGQPGKGRFVVFGDDAVFQNKFLVGENLQLARNLAAWLAPIPTRTAAVASPR